MTDMTDAAARMAHARSFKAKACDGLYLLHTVVYRQGAWWAVRVCLDGKGKEIGRAERVCWSHEVAAEIAHRDSVLHAPSLYRTVVAAESRAQRLLDDSRKRIEERRSLEGEASSAGKRVERLTVDLATARRDAATLRPRAELPQKPADLPTHLAMRWEDHPCREDAEERVGLLMAQLADAERAAKDFVEALTLSTSSDVEAKMEAEREKGRQAWIAEAMKLVNAPWT